MPSIDGGTGGPMSFSMWLVVNADFLLALVAGNATNAAP
jgi:hypothetical protein